MSDKTKSHRRVVVTGMGMASPLGGNTQISWENLLRGHAQLQRIKTTWRGRQTAQIAGYIPEFDASSFQARLGSLFNQRDQRRLDRCVLVGAVVAEEAIQQAGLDALPASDLERVGVIIGSGIGGLDTIMSTPHSRSGSRQPFYLPGVLINACSSIVAARHGFTNGICSPSASCATGALAIGHALRSIRHGYSDIVVCGGTEAATNGEGFRAFLDLRALARSGAQALEMGRPWDRDRSGFILSEGAGILVLEELDHALGRGAPIFAEVAGFGQSANAGDMVSPATDGLAVERCIRSCLDDAGWDSGTVEYINAHATGTPRGDDVELEAIARIFSASDTLPILSSTKGLTGHTLGAAGAIDAIICVKTIAESVAPGTHNLNNPSLECHIPRPKNPTRREYHRTISTSFGFGGVNASLAIARAEFGTGG